MQQNFSLDVTLSLGGGGGDCTMNEKADHLGHEISKATSYNLYPNIYNTLQCSVA